MGEACGTWWRVHSIICGPAACWRQCSCIGIGGSLEQSNAAAPGVFPCHSACSVGSSADLGSSDFAETSASCDVPPPWQRGDQ